MRVRDDEHLPQAGRRHRSTGGNGTYGEVPRHHARRRTRYAPPAAVPAYQASHPSTTATTIDAAVPTIRVSGAGCRPKYLAPPRNKPSAASMPTALSVTRHPPRPSRSSRLLCQPWPCRDGARAATMVAAARANVAVAERARRTSVRGLPASRLASTRTGAGIGCVARGPHRRQ